ncbi:MAG: hypothetical protein HC844_07090 [Tabrizicola sp.]|nr:hypothetical protein [Tabrizicola sp.]
MTKNSTTARGPGSRTLAVVKSPEVDENALRAAEEQIAAAKRAGGAQMEARTDSAATGQSGDSEPKPALRQRRSKLTQKKKVERITVGVSNTPMPVVMAFKKFCADGNFSLWEGLEDLLLIAGCEIEDYEN